MEEEEGRDVFSSAVLQRYGICPLVRGRARKPALNIWIGVVAVLLAGNVVLRE
ncbi:hypothetical protein TorRG33x02_046580 [Trema orientale]|uniref:Uncharacterized protein n=1 Tax=Trema orientale TaxID=63057 RepID=A0A2P5FNV4_TREOI|nr:hypothetical protein TorRG33x02_046580 [Trema orientale]